MPRAAFRTGTISASHRTRADRTVAGPRDQGSLRAWRPGGGAQRGAAPRSGAQAHRKGGGPTGGDGLFERTSGSCPFGEYVARMDVLDLYPNSPMTKGPVVCFDESPIQLIGEIRQPISAKPSELDRRTASTSAMARPIGLSSSTSTDPGARSKSPTVAPRSTFQPACACMRELTDVHLPKAERIRVVLDNLSIHSAGALY